MKIKFHCPHCTQRIEALGDVIGTIVNCPTCSKEFRIQPSLPPDLAHTDVKLLLQTLLTQLQELWRNGLVAWSKVSKKYYGSPTPQETAPAQFRSGHTSRFRKLVWIASGGVALAVILVFWFAALLSSTNTGTQTNSTANTGGINVDDPETLKGVLHAGAKLSGLDDGIKFAREYGRAPTEQEFADYLVQKFMPLQQYITEHGTADDLSQLRRMQDEYTQGFAEGCKGALDSNKPAF